MNLFKGLIFMTFLVVIVSACNENTKVTSENTETTEVKSSENVPPRASMQQGPVDMEKYQEQLEMGNTFFNSGTYQEALKHYKAAAAFNDGSEIQGKIALAVDKCYQEYLDKGKKYFDEKNYLYAKKEFETARIFRNIKEVNDLIQNCKENL